MRQAVRPLHYKVVISEVNSANIVLDVSDEMRVLDLKQQISQRKNFPLGTMTLVFQGDELLNLRTLGSYDLEPQTMIHLVVELEGGQTCTEIGIDDVGV